jgi:hypothetical protein
LWIVTTRILLAFAVGSLAFQDAPDRTASWNQDLDELARVISERHKNPFFKIRREEFFKAVDGVRKRIPDLKDHQVAVEFMKLAALIGDGHTAAAPSPEAPVQLRRYPIRALWLKDGYFIVAAVEEHKDLLRARITGVGKVPLEEAARRISVVAGADNASSARNQAAFWLTVAEALHSVGLGADSERCSYSIVDASGKERTVDLGLMSGRVRWLWGFDKDEKELSISRRLTRSTYGSEPMPDRKSLYAWYDACADQKNRPVSAWCEDVLKQVDDGKPERIVLDLRRNGGGNSVLIQPLIAGLKKRADLGRIFVLVDRPTFSSGVLNAVDFKRAFKAVLIGLPPGGNPNGYGEVRFLVLPNSKWRVQYSTKLFGYGEPGSDTLKPDVEVEPSAAEFFAGSDPALDAAIRFK